MQAQLTLYHLIGLTVHFMFITYITLSSLQWIIQQNEAAIPSSQTLLTLRVTALAPFAAVWQCEREHVSDQTHPSQHRAAIQPSVMIVPACQYGMELPSPIVLLPIAVNWSVVHTPEPTAPHSACHSPPWRGNAYLHSSPLVPRARQARQQRQNVGHSVITQRLMLCVCVCVCVCVVMCVCAYVQYQRGGRGLWVRPDIDELYRLVVNMLWPL